ncbi:MAG: hypothetical protein ACK56F_26845, partial [bacterium]
MAPASGPTWPTTSAASTSRASAPRPSGRPTPRAARGARPSTACPPPATSSRSASTSSTGSILTGPTARAAPS